MTLGEGMAGPPEDGEISEFLQYSTTAVVHIPELALPEPGIYAIAVYSNGVFIHRREFGVIHKPQAFTPEQLTQPQWESST
jgi:hypothetical protein